MLNRRQFTLGLTLLPLAGAAVFRAGLAPASACKRVRVTDASEPGVPLWMAGTLFAADGKTPLAGYALSIYHTDAEGYYSRPTSDPRKARLRARMVTDAQGGYAFETILPGRYPDRRGPAHIHAHLRGPDVPEHWIDSFLFAGDSYLGEDEVARERARGTFSSVVALERDSAGRLHGRRDLRFDAEAAKAHRLVDGWYAR